MHALFALSENTGSVCALKLLVSITSSWQCHVPVASESASIDTAFKTDVDIVVTGMQGASINASLTGGLRNKWAQDASSSKAGAVLMHFCQLMLSQNSLV